MRPVKRRVTPKAQTKRKLSTQHVSTKLLQTYRQHVEMQYSLKSKRWKEQKARQLATAYLESEEQTGRSLWV